MIWHCQLFNLAMSLHDWISLNFARYSTARVCVCVCVLASQQNLNIHELIVTQLQLRPSVYFNVQKPFNYLEADKVLYHMIQLRNNKKCSSYTCPLWCQVKCRGCCCWCCSLLAAIAAASSATVVTHVKLISLPFFTNSSALPRIIALDTKKKE